jgi:glucuronoarabinoxylan endo-1,4-beta-xylanase
MKKFLRNLVANKITLLIFISLYLEIFSFETDAQTLSVQGRIIAGRYRVREASITFIDNADTTKKFSALTNNIGNYQISVPTSIESNTNNLPSKFELAQNYPNPFSSSTSIPYNIHKQTDIQVTIYDILGREVRKFAIGFQTAGSYIVLWDGRNNFGQKVASGVYFYKIQAGSESQVKKMIFNSGGKDFISLPQTSFSRKLSIGEETNKYSEGNSYTVRIENTDSTYPTIIPLEFDNIQINDDTTINFDVDYLTSATIDFDSVHQIIRGFGAANIVGWRPDMTDSEIETAFGTGDGQLGFTILRLRIQPDSNQWSSNVTTALKAYNMGVTIIASPWSPPASMKTNNNLVRGELREDAYDDYASYLKAFADYMANNGVPLYALSLQNEPDANVSYESCDWSATQFLNFCKNNAQSVGYRIMMPESQNFVKALSDPTLNDVAAAANVSIIAGHIYGGGLTSYPLAEEKGKEVWMTERLTQSDHSANIWSYALDVGVELQRVMKANMSAYVWWYIVRYYGPIGDGESSTSFPDEDFSAKGEVTKKGYVMSQFARFIRPGFYRVESSVDPSINDVDVTAYKDSSSSKVVIVAINSGDTQAEPVFGIQNGTGTTTFTPYTTSEFKNCEQGDDFVVTGENFTFTLEPSSITTFVSN